MSYSGLFVMSVSLPGMASALLISTTADKPDLDCLCTENLL